MIVEVRSTGAHTVFPPSTHEQGEPITWEDEAQEPAEVDPEFLLDSASRLANTVLVELGEKRPVRERKKPSAAHQESPEPTTPTPIVPEDRAARCLAAMLRIKIVDQHDGSRRLFAVACRTVEHDLDDALAVATIREYARQRPFSKDWDDIEILKRLRDAETHCRRGEALELGADGCVPLGQREPQSGKLVLSPTRTLPTAEAFVREFHLHPDGRMIHCYAGVLSQWQDNRYCELEDNAVNKQLHVWLHDALCRPSRHRRTAIGGLPIQPVHGEVSLGIDQGTGASAIHNALPVVAGWRFDPTSSQRDRRLPVTALALAHAATSATDAHVLLNLRARLRSRSQRP